MKKLIKQGIKKLIPNFVKNKIVSLIARIAGEQISVNWEGVYQKLASLEKLEYKLNEMEQRFKRYEQKLASLEKLEYKLKHFSCSNEMESSRQESEKPVNVLSDAEYDRLEKEICRGRKIVESVYFDALCQNFVPRAKILDLGCGDGTFIKQMNAKGFLAEGIDANTQYADEPNIMLGYLPEALETISDNSYDVITSFHLIEHLPLERYKDMGKEIYRVLKKGGKIFFETPNTQSLITMSQYYYKDPTHLMPRHPEVYANILSFCGFKNLEIKNLSDLDQNPFGAILDESSELSQESVAILNAKFSKIEDILEAGSGNVLVVGEK